MELQPFQQLLDRYAAPLELYASQWTSAAEDCVQEAFIELAKQDQTPTEPVAWLYRVTRNKALNFGRADRRRANHERLASLLTVEASDAESSYQIDQQEMRQSVIEALNLIPAEDRELVVLRIWSGFGWQQIADLTGMPTSTAHRRYVVVLQKLKSILEPTCPNNTNQAPN